METTKAFIATYGQDTFERIFSVIYGDATYDDIALMEKFNRDVINSYGWVIYRTPNGDEVICNFEDGNWNGSQITSFGVDTDHVREHRVVRRFILDELRLAMEGRSDAIPLMRAKVEAEKETIAEKARAYTYDIFFSPTTLINNHYTEWAHERYLRIITEEAK